MDAAITAVQGRQLTLELRGGGSINWLLKSKELPEQGSTLTLGIRPEHLVRSNDEGQLSLGVDYAEHLGGVSYIYCHLPEGEKVIFESRLDRDAARGDALAVRLPPEHILLFMPDRNRLR